MKCQPNPLEACSVIGIQFIGMQFFFSNSDHGHEHRGPVPLGQNFLHIGRAVEQGTVPILYHPRQEAALDNVDVGAFQLVQNGNDGFSSEIPIVDTVSYTHLDVYKRQEQ